MMRHSIVENLTHEAKSNQSINQSIEIPAVVKVLKTITLGLLLNVTECRQRFTRKFP